MSRSIKTTVECTCDCCSEKVENTENRGKEYPTGWGTISLYQEGVAPTLSRNPWFCPNCMESMKQVLQSNWGLVP